MTKKTININGSLMDISSPKIMGILNITPDSFYAESRFFDEEKIQIQIEQMLADGMDIIDVGGYSSRPGAIDISEQQELDRIIPIIKFIKKTFVNLPISIDTFRAKVAEKSILHGAGMVNDISAGELDTKMFETIAELQVPYIAMHMKGTPQNMQNNISYIDIISEMTSYFSEKINRLHQLNINDIIIDPGFGFSKTLALNYEVLNKLDILKNIGKPILVGFSRKSMITKALDILPSEALNGTTILNTIAILKGANILRVHDVKEAKQIIILANLMNS